MEQAATPKEDRLDHLTDQVKDLERRMEKSFDRVDARFQGLETRFDSLQRTMILSMTSIMLAFSAQFVFHP